MANVLSLDTIEEFVFNTANVTIGDATLPGYAIKPTKAGLLDFDQNGTSIARLEIDGNVEAVGLQLRASSAERVMISGGANTIAASTYPGAWVGDATGLISGVVDDARLVGDYNFGNIVITDAVAANTVVGSLDASFLTSGTMHNDRLDGTYAFNSLDANVTAANAIGNINAINVTSGTLDDARLAGAYTFDSLTLSGNVDATSGIGNADASVVTAGHLSNDRLVGSYTIDAATTPVVDSDTVHVPSLEPNRVVVSDGSGVSSSATTVTELGYINDTTGSIQTQLDDVHAGAVTGSSLDHLVANNVTLGTLDDARLTGSYTFEHIVLTANQTAQIISANANASHLTTGLIDPGRLTATDYDDVGILTILDSLVASVVDAVLDADELVSGIVPDARMDGAYAFDSLELDTTANADWVHGAFDTSRLTTGEIPVSRFNFETVSSNIVSVGYRLGTESNRWDDVYANSATVDDIVIRPGGSVQSTQPSVVSMQLDLESTSSNIVASSASYTVGTPSTPWSNVYTTTAHVANSLIVDGNVTDPSGNSVGFDLENVDVALLPRYGDQWIGTNDRPWETIDASSLVVGDFGGNTITTALMSTNAATIGNESQPWSNVFASNITGSVDGAWVGDVWSQLDIFTGTIEALDGVTLKSEPVSFRFLPDETTGLGLVDGTTPGGVDVTVGGTVATRIINGAITQTGNVIPVGNNISSLGKPLFGYADLHANAVYTPVGKLDDGVLVDTFDPVGNVSFGSWSVSDSVVAASFVGNANASSIVSGTVSDGLFGGSYTVSNLDVSGSFAIDGSLACGDIVPTANATYDLGSTSNRFRDLYVSGSTILLGAASLSTVDGVVNISSNVVVTNGVSGSGVGAPLIISNVEVTDSEWVPLDDTAVALSGGYILLNGSGFAPSSIVKIGDTNAVATSYVSSTQLRAQVPAKSSGTYNVAVVRPDTKTATLPSALTYSDVVTWITSTSLGNVDWGTPSTISLQAESDSNITYSNTTSIPGTLNSSTGLLSFTLPRYEYSTYSFDISATDEQYQDAVRTFLLTSRSDVLTKMQASKDTANIHTTGSVTSVPNSTHTGANSYPYGKPVVLPSGNVLIPPNQFAGAKVYNPTNNTIIVPAQIPGSPTGYGYSCALHDGRVMLFKVGGYKAAIYTESSDSWTFTTPNLEPGVQLYDGRIFSRPTGGFYTLYDIGTDSVVQYATSLTNNASMILLDDGNVFGGVNYATVWTYNPYTNSFTDITSAFQSYASGYSTVARCLLPDGRVFSNVYNCDASQGAIIYDPADGTVMQTPSFPGSGTAAFYDCCLLPDGRVLIPRYISGVNHAIYNPVTNTVQSLYAPNVEQRSMYVCATKNGKALITPLDNQAGSVYIFTPDSTVPDTWANDDPIHYHLASASPQ